MEEINMKNKRKSLIGLGLIMALSVYAGAATTSNLKTQKVIQKQ